MFSGYLTKRDSPQSPPSMQKVFCVLWGTMLLDYDNEDDAKTLMNPKLVVELVGVSEWDGKGRANNYPGGLLLVTRTRRNYFASCSSLQERDEWILHFKRSLECSFANNEISPFRPSSIIQSRINTDARNTKCPRTDYQVNSYSPKCNSCGRRYYSSEHVSELCVLAQLGCEESEKVCLDCKNAQMCILWLKTMNYVQIMDLHELTHSVLTNVKKFHASFELRRRLSQRLDMAGELYANGSLTTEEFEELRSVDHAYRREVQHDECLKLKQAIEVFGEDLQTVLNILMNDSMTSKGGRNAYFTLILRVLELADHAPDLVDFYFPQLYQIHLQQLLNRTPDSYIKVDCLQQALLVLAKKFPSFGLKLNWSLMATIGDYHDKRATQVQFAACMSLLLQLEMVMMGQISSIADVPTSKVLHQVLRPAPHQQQEIGFEISLLFLIRRQLQEAYDAEEELRKDRNRRLYGDCNPDLLEEKEAIAKKLNPLPVYPGTNHTCSCTELLYHLGVGQAPSRTPQHVGISETQGVDQEVANVDNSSNDSNPISFWDGFDRQIDFLGRINALVDHLRFVDRPLRAETLKAQLHKWNNYGRRHESRDGRQRRSKSTNSITSNDQEGNVNLYKNDHSNSYRVGNPVDSSTNGSFNGAESISPVMLSNSMPSIDDLQAAARASRNQSRNKQSQSDASDEEPIILDHNPKLGWDPTTIAGEPHYRITRIVVDECRVFRTKARAPTMIVCEVMRDDVYRQHYANINLNNDRSSIQQPPSSSVLNKEATLVVNTPQNEVDFDAEEAMTGLFIDSPMYQSQIHSHGNSSLATRERSSSMSVPKLAFANSNNVSLHHNQIVDNANPVDNVSFSNPGQSLQDVDSLIESSLNPVIAEMQLHRQQQQQEEQQDQNPPISSSPMTLQQQRTSAMSTTVQALPRRRSGGILPTNRLSASTEGILRSSSHINLSANTSNGIAASVSNTIGTVADINENNTNDVDDSVSTIEEELIVKDPNLQHIVTSAQRLLRDGMISDREYRQLIMSDLNYREEIAREAALIEKSRVENVLGESFQSKKERILGSKFERHRSNSSARTLSNSSQGTNSVSLHRLSHKTVNPNNSSSSTSNKHSNAITLSSSTAHEENSTLHENFWPSYDLRAFIVKTNDDLRQEICCMQLMQIFKEIFDHFSLSHMLFLKPYRIISTGSSSGVVEVLQDAVSLDALKHTTSFTSLANHFNTVYDTTPERLQRAKHNFMASLAAYSLFSYLLLVKDRHNGNLLIDSDGHIIHIDFGFILSIAPGGSFSVETAPFKLTEEMVELLDGLDSPLFGEFVTAFTKGFIALQANCENILSAITILSHNSSFPCFRDKPVAHILDKLRARFRTELNVQDAVKHCLDLITNSYGHYGTRQYDQFQYFTNGILA